MSMKHLYKKLRSGDALTDQEVIDIRAKFLEISHVLSDMGDIFYCARAEANRRFTQVDDYYVSRGLHELERNLKRWNR